MATDEDRMSGSGARRSLDRRHVLGFAPLIGAGALLLGNARPSAGSAPAQPQRDTHVSLNVRDFGAVGDGTTKDSLAFQQALDRCAMLGGGEVLVPAGIYLIGAIAIGAHTVLRVDASATLIGSPDLADYPIRQVRWEGRFVKGRIGLIHAENADGIGLAGKGRIVGNPAIKGRIDAASGLRNPALMEFIGCHGVEVRDVFTQQNGMWSIHPIFCTDVRFSNMTINGGADGIDLDSCERVVIERCTFDTRDDCISLKSGRGEEGYMLARPTLDVRIADCVFSDHVWACIGIGSETSGGIRGVRVERCRFLGARTHAIYIKSRPGRGAYIEDIVMDGLEVSGAGQGFLRFNFVDSGKQDEFPVPGLDGIPTVRNFSFSNVRVSDVPVLVDGGAIHPAKPLKGLTLANISGTCRRGIALANVEDARLTGIKVTGYDGPLLSIHNVSGRGLEGAAALSPPVLPVPVPVPVPTPLMPYVLK